jgi:DUF4097 and DUF4098 domain-containing protein YvlB
MKTQAKLFSTICGCLLMFTTAIGRQTHSDKVTVPLTDPSRPVFLKIGLLSGGITVKGYAGKEVIVEATTHPDDEGDDDEGSDKRKGLKLIPNSSTGLTIEEDNNTVFVSNSGRWGSRQVDLDVQVPVNCSMKLSTVNDGNILVTGVHGDFDINNTNGSVTLKDVSGSALAHALNGDILVTMNAVNPDKPMSFSSLNGEIDVTFPSTIKASVQIDDEQGQVYSDFDMQLDKSKPVVEESSKKSGGKYKVTIDKGMKGTINSGGQEIQFKNFNGNIYLRKGK